MTFEELEQKAVNLYLHRHDLSAVCFVTHNMEALEGTRMADWPVARVCESFECTAEDKRWDYIQ
jgi:hypothetical protein